MTILTQLKPSPLFCGLFLLNLMACVEATEAAQTREDLLQQLAEQAGPILQLEADIQGLKKLAVEDAKDGVDQLLNCVDGRNALMKVGADGKQVGLLSLDDQIPVANGPLKIKSYFNKCVSLLKRMGSLKLEACTQRELEIWAQGTDGNFGPWSIRDSDRACKRAAFCKIGTIDRKARYGYASCLSEAIENFPAEFRSEEKRIRAVCGTDSLVIFDKNGVQTERFVKKNQSKSVKFARFSCYRDKSLAQPFHLDYALRKNPAE